MPSTQETTPADPAQATNPTTEEKQYIPVIVENPCLVQKMSRVNKLVMLNMAFILFDIFLSILFLSIIYGNQSQLFRFANKNQTINEIRTTEMCNNTATAVAEKVTSELKVQNEQRSKKVIDEIEKLNKSTENKKALK